MTGRESWETGRDTWESRPYRPGEYPQDFRGGPAYRPGNATQVDEEPATVRGTIVSLASVKLAGVDQLHEVARVETPSGRVARVDLGPRPAVTDLGLREGDRVSVQGFEGTINDRPMLMATSVMANGQMARVDRTEELGQQRVSGEIVSTRVVMIDGGEHLLARIQSDDGSMQTVNLGPRLNVREAGIVEGDRVFVSGFPAEIQGRPVIQAEQIQHHGRTMEVSFPGKERMREESRERTMERPRYRE